MANEIINYLLLGDDDVAGDASLDIANIDARLNALQRFMKTNLNEA